ncbi:MAG: HAD-IIA family hydrolase [Jatrophihabitans sp.]|uniref:HAD-IIA family hydrolase n=1 Tax=Jatrophihabitans sp. TaxID=1932789 RepID=UPI00390FF512
MRPVAPYLRGSTRRLAEEYDVALLDLDGVVYVGPDAVPGAPEALAAARAAGMRLAFVTNNAARPPHVVADHLTELGIAATASEVITSAQAAARYLGERLPGGARVLVVGTSGLEQALRERGLVPVSDATGQVDAVVQGYSPDLNWQMLAEGAVALNRGVLWVATNVDPTVPSPRGPLPGNGSLVAALRMATGREPVVTGKPDPTMHRESLLRSEANDPIVVGDRLDTDIEGANAVGCASLLVLSGVTSVRAAIEAPPKLRPSYLGSDVSALLVAHPEPRVVDGGAVCGAWQAGCTDVEGDAALILKQAAGAAASAGSDEAGAGDLDAWRALCAAAWAAFPDRGADGIRVHPDTDPGREAAGEVLGRLGLA